jgi:hypothetical protein
LSSDIGAAASTVILVLVLEKSRIIFQVLYSLYSTVCGKVGHFITFPKMRRINSKYRTGVAKKNTIREQWLLFKKKPMKSNLFSLKNVPNVGGSFLSF